jgi:hypothetical protein
MEEFDLCPTWWPWPFRHPIPHTTEGPHPEPWDEIPAGGRTSLQLFRALTSYNMAYQFHDAEAQAQIQGLALRQVGELSAKLQNEQPGRSRGTRADDDVELCPRWWPWPWPGPGPRGGPQPEPWKEIPQGGQISLQLFRALTIFNMAYQYHDEDAQAQIQRLALGQVGELAAKLQKNVSY